MNFTPKESTQYPGFYHPTGTDLVVVSRDGRVINLLTGNEIKTKPNENGYTTFGVWIKVNGEDVYKNFNLHRLLALAFIPIPDNLRHLTGRQLTVNHVDTNKRNNAVGNLEWKSSQGNTIHAYENELSSMSKAVLAKSIHSGAIERFVSVQECAREFDVDNQLLRAHLNSEDYGTRFHGGCVFKFDDDTEWPQVYRMAPLTANRAVIGYSVDTGLKVLDVSSKALCENVGINAKGYGNHIKAKGPDVPYHGWLIKDIDLKQPLDMHLFDEWTKSEKKIHHTVVSYNVTNVVTKEQKVLNGTKAVSDHVGYSVQSIGDAIKNRNGLIGDYQIEKLDRHKLLNTA